MNAAASGIILLYGLSTAAYLLYLIVQGGTFYKAGYALLLAGFLLHLVLLTGNVIASGHLPVFTLSQTLWVAGGIMAGVFLVLHRRLNLRFFGIYVAPLVLMTTLVAVVLPETNHSDPAEVQKIGGNIWFLGHILAVFVGEASLALAAGAGLFYLIQERAIKTKKRGFFYRRLPPLKILDGAGYTCLVVGFTALTLGLIVGIVYAGLAWGRFWSWDPKEVWSGITWLVYAALLHERLAAGWRGRRAAIMAIIGFGILLFTFLGVNFFLEGHHGGFTRI